MARDPVLVATHPGGLINYTLIGEYRGDGPFEVDMFADIGPTQYVSGGLVAVLYEVRERDTKLGVHRWLVQAPRPVVTVQTHIAWYPVVQPELVLQIAVLEADLFESRPRLLAPWRWWG